jgi:RNA polymerase sigma-54 factor
VEEHLVWQLNMSKMDETEHAIGLYIIGNLDENGYLAAGARPCR